MAPLTKESEIPGQTNMAGSSHSAKPQPVAVEIPVTVNGACTVAGSDKREPFSETTQTVLVFASGAVIRLAAGVGPGQLLFVTNEKSKKEVVCQVVKSKQNGSAGGYVELKFTEPAADFWGVRLPGAAPMSVPASPSSATSISLSSPPTRSLEQRITELNSTTSPALAAATPKPVEMAAPVPELPRAPVAKPAPQAREPKLAPVVTLPSPSAPPIAPAPPASISKVPTLSEFLTRGENGLELSVDKGNAPKLRPQEQSPANQIEVEKPTAPSPSFLPVPIASDSTPGLSIALGINQNPAPGTLTFDLAAEEVKIPAWLEPLARNSMPQIQGNQPAEGKVAETRASDELDMAVVAPAPQTEAADSENQDVFTVSQEGRAPNFGSTLPLDAQAEEAKGSGKSWKIALLIVAVLLAAAAIWYWYVNQPLKVSAGGNRDAEETNNEGTPTQLPASAASVTAPGASSSAEVDPISSKSAEPVPATTASAPTRSPANSTGAPRVQPLVEAPPTPAAVPAKKPALGDVHLAAPVVARRAGTQENGTADPGLVLGGVSGAVPNDLSLLAGKGKEPAAPIPVGGQVKAAKLVSSVPPTYPQLARAQRLSGDVTLDALIDTNGRVSATKVLSGPALLHQSAIEAVKQWKYQPATLNGQPTPMHLTVTVQFRLQ